MNKKHIAVTAAITAVIMIILTSLFYIGTPVGRRLYSIAAESTIGKNHSKFLEIEELLEQNYMGEIDQNKMMENAFFAYVATLGDPYTSYLTKDAYSDMQQNLGGGYSGIGIEISINEDNKIFVSGVKKDSPADKGGMKTGDLIIKIDSEEYTGDQIDEAVSKIKNGKTGTEVEITVERDGNQIDLTIIRENIDMDYVTSKMLDSSIGYIRIKTFGKGTAKSFESELENLKNNGMETLIIDLRANPGGLLEEVVEMTDLLVPNGVITTVKDNKGDSQYYRSGSDEISVPMCVLIDSGSASASEVMAGALRDYDKATLIGENTFGKGVVQGMYDFGDGTGMRITVAKYYTPSGECIHGVGIKPDIEISLPDGASIGNFSDTIENDTQLEKATEILQNRTDTGETEGMQK